MTKRRNPNALGLTPVETNVLYVKPADIDTYLTTHREMTQWLPDWLNDDYTHLLPRLLFGMGTYIRDTCGKHGITFDVVDGMTVRSIDSAHQLLSYLEEQLRMSVEHDDDYSESAWHNIHMPMLFIRMAILIDHGDDIAGPDSPNEPYVYNPYTSCES